MLSKFGVLVCWVEVNVQSIYLNQFPLERVVCFWRSFSNRPKLCLWNITFWVKNGSRCRKIRLRNTSKLIRWFALIYGTFISCVFFFFFQLSYCCLTLECCVSLSNQYIKFIRRSVQTWKLLYGMKYCFCNVCKILLFLKQGLSWENFGGQICRLDTWCWKLIVWGISWLWMHYC